MKLPCPKTTVILREVSEGAILFATETEVYFSLNQIGLRVWRLLPECDREDEVVARLHTEYSDVSVERIAADVRSLMKELEGAGLVEARQAA